MLHGAAGMARRQEGVSAAVPFGVLEHSEYSAQFSYLPLSGPAVEHSSPRRRQERLGEKKVRGVWQ